MGKQCLGLGETKGMLILKKKKKKESLFNWKKEEGGMDNTKKITSN